MTFVGDVYGQSFNKINFMSNLQIYRASAGSGKTHILTQQYLKLAFQYPDKFIHILAVTFTNKAAEEMKERIIKELNSIVKKGNEAAHFKAVSQILSTFSEKQIQQRALDIRNNILHNYSQFSISTIDSFVQKVIRSFAYEINIPAGYKIEMDYEKVVNEITNLLYGNITENEHLQKWLKQFAKYKIDEGKNWDFREEIHGLANEIFKERFQSFENDNLNVSNKEILNELLIEVIKIKNSFEKDMNEISKQAKYIINNYNINTDNLGRNFKTITRYLTEKISELKDFEPGTTVYNALDCIENWYAKSAKKDVISTITSVYDKLNISLHDTINLFEKQYTTYLSAINILHNFHSFGILSDIADILPLYRDDNNLLLISDSTLLLKKIVENNDTPFIYEKVGTKYHHILIDEFQDTSGFQWSNFKPLIENSLATGQFNLIVGDIKQSIYRWRGGDWRILLQQVQNDIGKNFIKEETLDTNWRSKKNIIDFNNILFYHSPRILQQNYNAELDTIIDASFKKNMITKGYDDILLNAYSDSYQHLSPNKPSSGGRTRIEFIKTERKNMKSKWKEEVKLKLPQTIENLLKNKNYSPKDITILVRKNKEGKEVVDMLLDYQNSNIGAINYDLISSESLFITNSKSVRLIISALKYIYDCSDSINLSILIYEYSLISSNNFDSQKIFDTKNKADLTHFLPQEFINQVEALRKLSVFELIETLMSIFKLSSISEEYPYLRTLQDAVLEFTRNEYSDIDKFIEWWNEKGSKISIQLSDKQDAVTIMTIHKSKGLAFKVVIIPFCDWDLDHSSYVSPIIWCKTDKEPFNKFNFLPIKYKKELSQTIFQQDYFDEKLYVQIDALNMLYVAFTRPEEELIIFAPTDQSDKVSQVSDLLYKTIQLSNVGFTEKSKQFISLIDNFDEEKCILSVENGYNEVDTDKYKKESSEKTFPLNEYPNFDWREKISLVAHADDFFIKSIQHVENKVNYGTLMHNILSLVTTIDKIDEALDEIRMSGFIDFEDFEMRKKQIIEIVTYPKAKDWFTNKWQINSESEILTSKGEIKIPDRILFSEKEVIVIDFKFGEIKTDYESQIREYMKIVSEIEPDKKIKGFLYYADIPKIIEVDLQMKLF